jgi:hypothetical protein
VIAVGAVGGAVRVWPGTSPGGGGGDEGALTLAGDASDGIGELVVPLAERFLARRSDASRSETGALVSTRYSMLALTWQDPRESPLVEIRSRTDGRWSDWRRVPHLQDVPDAGAGEGTAVGGTDLIWVGPSDGVQARVTGPSPSGLSLVLLEPWAQPDDLLDQPDERSAPTSVGQVPEPELRGRRRWGADESWRQRPPRYNTTIKQVHVHHTVNSNDYGRSDVPALIRGMYRYHTKYLGWSDIGYNFLVDRFGRIWTGRAGGAGRPVRGAHTLGFNGTSAGVSVIGNFELVTPSAAVLEAVASVAAWKLQRYHRDPHQWVEVRSEGSDRFRAGRVVTLPSIDGHRDTNMTACPGTYLYDLIPNIRHRAAVLIERYSKVRVVERPVLTGTPALGETLTVQSGTYTPADVGLRYVWLRNKTRIPDAAGPTYVVREADVGKRLSVRVVARRAGLKANRRRLWTDGPVECHVTVMVDPHVRDKRRLRVDVHVASPPGVRATPTGKVIVKVGSHRAVVRLTDGHGVARFGRHSPLRAGRHRIRVRYKGDRAHFAAHAVTHVRIRR